MHDHVKISIARPFSARKFGWNGGPILTPNGCFFTYTVRGSFLYRFPPPTALDFEFECVYVGEISPDIYRWESSPDWLTVGGAVIDVNTVAEELAATVTTSDTIGSVSTYRLFGYSEACVVPGTIPCAETTLNNTVWKQASEQPDLTVE